MGCVHCRGYEVVDHGFDLPDHRAEYRVLADDEEGEDETVASVVVVREWFTCECNSSTEMDYKVTFEVRLADGRVFPAKSESEGERLVMAVHPDATLDNEWRQDQRTMLGEMGIMC
jgi:hypothetical protein